MCCFAKRGRQSLAHACVRTEARTRTHVHTRTRTPRLSFPIIPPSACCQLSAPATHKTRSRQYAHSYAYIPSHSPHTQHASRVDTRELEDQIASARQWERRAQRVLGGDRERGEGQGDGPDVSKPALKDVLNLVSSAETLRVTVCFVRGTRTRASVCLVVKDQRFLLSRAEQKCRGLMTSTRKRGMKEDGRN